jgi:N-acylneuraminate cytidylyltransferase
VLDFDGVMTDNRALILQDGREAVLCNRSDGLAIAALKATGAMLLVLSSEANSVVRARCDKLGVECLQGIGRKWPVLAEWLAKRNIDPAHVVYVGNDVNDLECLQSVGCGVAVADSHEAVRSAARIILDAGGGRGAVREIADLFDLAQKRSGTGSLCVAAVRCQLSVVSSA